MTKRSVSLFVAALLSISGLTLAAPGVAGAAPTPTPTTPGELIKAAGINPAAVAVRKAEVTAQQNQRWHTPKSPILIKNPKTGKIVETPEVRKSLDAAKAAKAKGPAAPASLTTCDCYVHDENQQNPVQHPTAEAADYQIVNPFLAQTTNNRTQADAHTLMQAWDFSVPSAGSDGGGNGVEYGEDIGSDVNGDVNTHIFTFFVRDGYNHGSCWNMCIRTGTTPWFISYKGMTGFSPVGPGDSIQSAVGTTKNFQSSHFDNTGCAGCAGWWISYNGLYMGYYPQDIWTSMTPSENFVDMNYVNNGGEIAKHYLESCTDMGTGDSPTGTVGAMISNMTFNGSTDTPNLSGNMFSEFTNGANWGYAANTSGVNGIRVGGPGFDSVAGATGVKSHCAPNTERDPGTFGSLLTNREYCPDSTSLVTGCNAVVDLPYASDTINVIHSLPVGQQDIVQAWGKYGVSGKSYYLCASSSCASTSRVLVTNAAKVNVKASLGASPHAYERAA